MCVKFSDNGDVKREDFYYREADAPKGSGLGTVVFVLEILQSGNSRSFMGDTYEDIPEEFFDICHMYQFERRKLFANLNKLHKNV